MKTSEVTLEDIQSSVLAVPPLARHDDYTFNHDENEALVRYLERGGVTTLLYGGNANLYNVGLNEYGNILQALTDIAGDTTWIIPSVGPSYGMFMDQAEVLKDHDFPTAMVLPTQTAANPEGVETGLRHFAASLGKPIVVYLKYEDYLTVEGLGRLVDDGLVCAVKYAVVRNDPTNDAFLSQLCKRIDSRLLISGIGERPAVVHWRDFGLRVFTSGSVCIAPRQSTQLLNALKQLDYNKASDLRERFLPLEDLRDSINPIRVLHDAVTLAEVANMGPILPLASNIDAAERRLVEAAAKKLAASETVAV